LLPNPVTHAIYGAASWCLFAGFGEGCFLAAFAAVLVDLDSPGRSLLHSPLLLGMPGVLAFSPLSGYAFPVLGGVLSHLVLDCLTRDGIVVWPGRRFPGAGTREGLPHGDASWLNLGISGVSAAALLLSIA